MKEIIIGVHGYSQDVPPGYRPWEDVVDDRLLAGLSAAKFLQEVGKNIRK